MSFEKMKSIIAIKILDRFLKKCFFNDLKKLFSTNTIYVFEITNTLNKSFNIVIQIINFKIIISCILKYYNGLTY